MWRWKLNNMFCLVHWMRQLKDSSDSSSTTTCSKKPWRAEPGLVLNYCVPVLLFLSIALLLWFFLITEKNKLYLLNPMKTTQGFSSHFTCFWRPQGRFGNVIVNWRCDFLLPFWVLSTTFWVLWLLSVPLNKIRFWRVSCVAYFSVRY